MRVAPWAEDTSGLSLLWAFPPWTSQASKGKPGGSPGKGLPVWPPGGCKWWALPELSVNPSPPSPPRKSLCLHGKGPLIFPPEVMVEIYSTWVWEQGNSTAGGGARRHLRLKVTPAGETENLVTPSSQSLGWQSCLQSTPNQNIRQDWGPLHHTLTSTE